MRLAPRPVGSRNPRYSPKSARGSYPVSAAQNSRSLSGSDVLKTTLPGLSTAIISSAVLSLVTALSLRKLKLTLTSISTDRVARRPHRTVDFTDALIARACCMLGCRTGAETLLPSRSFNRPPYTARVMQSVANDLP